MQAFTLQSHGKSWSFDPVSWSDEFVQDMMEQGVKIRLDRSSASDKTPQDRLASCQALYDKLAQGILPSGSGRGGPRLAWEDKAERDILEAIFVAIGEKVVIAKKSAAADNAWERVTRLTLLQQYAAEGKTPDEIKQMDLKALVVENLDSVRELYADDIADKAEKLKAAAEKKPALKTIPKGIKVGE